MDKYNQKKMKAPMSKLHTLERIEEAIKMAWLKDLDKTAEMNELLTIQAEMLDCSSIMEYFDNSRPCFDYFVNKFSKEVIMNLLRQNYVYGHNGDEIVLRIFVNFLKIWFKFHKNPSLTPLFENIRELLKSNHAYYKSQMTHRVTNKKKAYDAEVFNESLPKNKETFKDFSVGETVDVLINYKESKSSIDQKAWVRGKVAKVENGNYIILICEPQGVVVEKIGSLNVLRCGVATKDWDWRINLKQWDVIDCYDRGSWYPATVCLVNQTEVNEQIKSLYRIGFRLYPEHFSDYKRYQVFWQLGNLTDSNGKEYIGDRESFDEFITFYSNRIQRPSTRINFKNARNCMHYSSSNDFTNEELSNFFVDSLYLYEYEGKKHHIIGKGNNFSYYYALLLDSFAKENGFEDIIRMLEDKPSSEDMLNVFYLLSHSIPYLHQGYLLEMSGNIFKVSLAFFKTISNEDMRNLKRDLVELIGQVLGKVEEACDNLDQTSDIIEEITLTISLKMMKTTIFDKRLQGIKALNDFIRANKNDKGKLSKTIQLIQENEIINEIFGANSHSQIISKAADIVKLLLEEDKITEKDINFIWEGTQKGDLEGKINILNLLSETSSLLQPKHVDILLSSIYSHIDNDLNTTEIDLVYNLSIQRNNEVNIEKCITFFTQCLLNSKNADNTKLSNIISKVINITNMFDKHITTVLSLCLKCIEANSHVILSYKILCNYLESFSTKGAVIDLISNNKLLDCYISNWKQYSKEAKEYLKANKLKETDNNDSIMIDSFSHEDNLAARVTFAIYLYGFYPEFDSIPFLYEMLFKEAVSSNDYNYLFTYCQILLEAKKSESIVDQLYDFLNKELGQEERFINSLTGFNVFLKLFLSLNSRKNNIIYFPSAQGSNSKQSVSSLINPKDMIGFGLLWEMIFKTSNNDIMLQGIEILHTLFASSNLLDDLLQKCIELVKAEQQLSTTALSISSMNKIKKALKVLITIIEESEIQGTGRVKSHLALCKKSKQKVRVFVKSKISNFDLNVYANTTISEIRDLCAEKTKINQRYLRIANSNSEEIPPLKNGKTLIEMNIQPNEEIILSISNSMARAELFINNEINPKFENIISNWFETYSIDGKMTRDTCAKFTSSVIVTKEPLHIDNHRINLFFNNYDKENKGYLSKEDFIQFYTHSARTKPDVVWDNLATKHIDYYLNDTRQPIAIEEISKATLPRYQLSLNSYFFNELLLLFQHEELVRDLFDFLFTVTTNLEIYNDVLFKDKMDYWKDSNTPLGVYILHIVQSFIEDIELSNEANIDSYVNSEFDGKIEEKIDWIKRLITKGNLRLITSSIGQAITNGHLFINQMLLVSTITIVKSFIQSSLYIYEENYQQIFQILSGRTEEESQEKKKEEDSSFDPYNNKITHYFKEAVYNKSKSKKEDSELDSLLIVHFPHFDKIIVENKLEKEISNAIDYNLAKQLIDYTASLLNNIDINNNNKDSMETKKRSRLIILLFDFLMSLLTFNVNQDSIKIILNDKHAALNELIQKGIMHLHQAIRETFGKILMKYAKISELLNNHPVLSFLFSACVQIFNNVIQSGIEKGSHFTFFFDFFLILFKIIYSSSSVAFKEELNQSDIQQEEFIMNIYNLMYKSISSEDQGELQIDMLVGLTKMLTKALEHSSKLRERIMSNESLIEIILTKVLFNEKANEVTANTKHGFISLNDLQKSKNRFASIEVKKAFYDLLLLKFNDDMQNIKLFLRIQSLKEKEDSEESKGNKYYQPLQRHFHVQSQPKSEGHVGLQNLGCICYMNSILQQMFMVPTFRHVILQAEDNKPKLMSRDDNVLHQLQRMYTFLLLSEREDYNPKEFCYSFKDFDGQPINISIQQDSQEFLNSFCDKIENLLKETTFKYIVNNIFVGRTCSQVICEMCGNVSNRFEDFYNLTLEVSKMSSLNESLKKFIEPEKIENFSCERCNKKVTISKRTSFSDLPNVLIIYLKRFCMNYEIERAEKINTKLEFPNKINLKSFCIEELMHAKDPSYETDEIYFKEDEYYEYVLVGINVHIGSADGGHYFSFISTKRDGRGNESDIQEIDLTQTENAAWLKFNDSSISKFNVQTINTECYGGLVDRGSGFTFENCQSAYLLYYERRKKTPLKLLIPKPEDEKDLISYKDEQRQSIHKLYDISRKKKEEQDNSALTSHPNQIFYDSSRNEFYKYEKFYDLQKMVPSKYYFEVIEDNSQFQQGQKKDDSYSAFFNKVFGIFQANIKSISYEGIDPSIRVDCFNLLLQLLLKRLSTSLTPDSITELKQLIQSLIVFISKDRQCLSNAGTTLNSSKLINDLFDVEDESLLSDITPLIKEIIIRTYNNRETKPVSLSIIDIFLHHLPSLRMTKLKTISTLLEAIVHADEEIMSKLYDESIVKTIVEFLRHMNHEAESDTHVHSIINLLYDIIKRSVEFNSNTVIASDHKTEGNKSQYYLHSQINCFNTHSILLFKIIFKVNVLFFTDLMLMIQENNETLTGDACEEICTYINDLNIEDTEAVERLLQEVIFKLLKLRDNYQFERLHIMLGYPLMIIGKPRGTINWPCFGYHLMKKKSSPFMHYVSRNRNLKQNCLLAKITASLSKQESAKSNIATILLLLESAVFNYALFKYLYLMPWESLLYGNAFDAFVALTDSYIKETNDEAVQVRLNKVKEKAVEFVEKLKTNDDQLRAYTGFKLDYIPKDIVKERIEFVVKGVNLYFIRMEYFTNIIELNGEEIDFSQSNSNSELRDRVDEDDEDEDDSGNDNDDLENEPHKDNEVVVDAIKRPDDDVFLLKQLLPTLLKNTKVIVLDKHLKNVPCTLTVVRNVIYNGTMTNVNIDSDSKKRIQMERRNSSNDFFPRISKSRADSFKVTDLILYHKFEHRKEVTSNDEIQVNISTS